MIEYLYGFLIALAVGVIVALVGYFLSIKSATQERKAREKERLINAVRSILSEFQNNLEIAKQPFQGRLIPFVTSMFSAYAGEITRLPNNLQHTVYQAYVEIDMGNAIVQTDLHKIQWGGGYLDNKYQEQCKRIIEKGENAKQLLEDWIKKEGGEGISL